MGCHEGLVRRAALVVAGHMLDVAAPLALASPKVVPGFVPVGLVEGLVRRAALVLAGHRLDLAAPLALASQKVAPGFAPVGLAAPVRRAALVFGAVAGHMLDVAARALDVLQRWLVWAGSLVQADAGFLEGSVASGAWLRADAADFGAPGRC